MATRRHSPNWETLDQLLKLAAKLLSLYELLRRAF
jgi:hypothetical protein